MAGSSGKAPWRRRVLRVMVRFSVKGRSGGRDLPSESSRSHWPHRPLLPLYFLFLLNSVGGVLPWGWWESVGSGGSSFPQTCTSSPHTRGPCGVWLVNVSMVMGPLSFWGSLIVQEGSR